MMLPRRFLCLLLCLTLLLCTMSMPVSQAESTAVHAAPMSYASNAQDGMVRVYLSSLGSRTSLTVIVNGSYTAEGKTSVSLKNGSKVSFSFNTASGAITMTCNGTSYAMGTQMALRRHQSEGVNGLRIQEARMPSNLYPGDLFLTAQKSGASYKLYPIVHVYIENYLAGVVPYEMGDSAHIEALKAQAVAARTYTLSRMITREKALYDVVDTTNDQVYFGNSESTKNCTEAVNATRGIVLMNGGELTGTYYTASNGGQTESAANLWGSKNLDYLSVRDDPFDRLNPQSSVKTCVVYEDLTNPKQSQAIRSLLNQKAAGQLGSGAQVMRVESITPHSARYASPSRLYTKMDFGVIVQRNGQTQSATLTFDIFSELEGPLNMSINNSRNELWSVEHSGTSFVITAGRFGHGIGMSQRGAMKMGEMGYTYDMILGFYYEGCQRVQCVFVSSILSSPASGSQVIESTDQPAPVTVSGDTALVEMSGMNQRMGILDQPGVSGRVLTSVIHGGMVTVLARGENWTLVRLGRIVGYAPSDCLRFGANPPTQSAQKVTPVSKWAQVSCTGKLNLRSLPGYTGEVRTAIPSGEWLSVFTTDGEWAWVQYGAVEGYCAVDFLTFTDHYPFEVALGGSMTATVKTEQARGMVNVRASASTTAKILAAVPGGSQVTVLQSDGSWCYVRYQETLGYMRADYLSGGSINVASPAAPLTPAAPALSQGETEAVVQVSNGSLNVRTQPSENAEILTTLSRGASVIVTSRGESWCQIRFGSMKGYVMTRYLRFPGDTPGQTDTAQRATVQTGQGSLNMRTQAKAGSTIVTRIPRGASVIVYDTLGSWVHVGYEGYTGYVLGSYLNMSPKPTAAPAVGRTASVQTGGGTLNLREKPDSSAKRLAAIPQGATVTAYEATGEWTRVAYAGQVGYVMSKYLSFSVSPTPAPTAVPTPQPVQSAWITLSVSAGVRMRTAPSTSASVLVTLQSGEEVRVLARGDTWTQVQWNSQTGYIMTEYLVWTKPETSTPLPQHEPMDAWVIQSVSNGVNLRERPDESAVILLTLQPGEPVTVLAYGDDWSQIRWYSLTGYAMTKYLTWNPSAAQATLAPQATTDAASMSLAWVREDLSNGVRLRERASTQSAILLTLPAGQSVTVLSRGSTWTQIQCGSLSGYIMTEYLQFTQSAINQSAAYVNTASTALNLREAPSVSAKVIGSIPKGGEVTALQALDGWYLVEMGGLQGYASASYLKPVNPAQTATPTLLDPTLREVWGVLARVSAPNGLTLRAWCTQDAPLMSYIPSAAAVELVQRGANWCMVLYEGVTGYCLTSDLTLLN